MSYSSVITADTPAIWYRFVDGGLSAYRSFGSDPAYGRNNPTGESVGWTGIATDGGAVAVNAGLSNQRALAAHTGTTAYSFEVWIWLVGVSTGSSNPPGNPFIKGTYGCGSGACGVQWATASGPLWQGQGPTGTTLNAFTQPFNQWTHLVITVTVGSLITYYQDGTSAGTITETNTTPLVPEYGITWLNALAFSPIFIAEPAVYTYALTSTQVGNHHAAADTLAKPRPRAFPVASVCA